MVHPAFYKLWFGFFLQACRFYPEHLLGGGRFGVIPVQPMLVTLQRKGLGPNPTGAAGEKQEGFRHGLAAGWLGSCSRLAH